MKSFAWIESDSVQIRFKVSVNIGPHEFVRKGVKISKNNFTQNYTQE